MTEKDRRYRVAKALYIADQGYWPEHDVEEEGGRWDHYLKLADAAIAAY